MEPKTGRHENASNRELNIPPKTVIFVEHFKGEELATRRKELVGRLAPTLGFIIKEGLLPTEEQLSPEQLAGRSHVWER